jgi:hypothetical protein
LFDGVAHEGGYDVIGNASFARTVVVHDIAETQRALLHSVTPTGGHRSVCIHALRALMHTGALRSYAGAGRRVSSGGRRDKRVSRVSSKSSVQFDVGRDPARQDLAIVQVTGG